MTASGRKRPFGAEQPDPTPRQGGLACSAAYQVTVPIPRKKGSPEELAFFKKTIENAERLAADAKILGENERASSAIMIAILTL